MSGNPVSTDHFQPQLGEAHDYGYVVADIEATVTRSGQ